MAQAKTANLSNTSPSSSPRLLAKATPRVRLEAPVEIVTATYLGQEPSVTVMEIPLKSETEEVNLENTYVSQLADGRLIYCYEDGEIGLYTTHDSNLPSEKFSVLPEGRCTFVHELPLRRLLICQKNADAYLLSLDDNKTVVKLSFSGQKVKCAFAIDDQTLFLGTKDGKLIHWDLNKNELIHCWSVSKPDREDSPSQSSYFPIIGTQANLNHKLESGVPILCLAKNCDGQLFLLLQFEDGFITGQNHPFVLR